MAQPPRTTNWLSALLVSASVPRGVRSGGALMLAAGLLAGSSGAAPPCGSLVPPSLNPAESVTQTGRYSNPNYCFALTIPEGLAGLSSPAPAPHHGFGVILPGSPGAYIYADGSYNALEISSAWAYAGLHLEWLADEGHTPEAAITATSLGTRPAVRLVARYACPQSGLQVVTDTFLALERGVVYTLSLTTTAARYPTDRLTLEQMARSWSFNPVSCQP